MRVRPFLMIQFLSTLIRGREHRHFRSPKCPAPGTSGPRFFSEVQNATFQNGSGGLVVPRYFCQTDIGLWPRTSDTLFGLVVPRYFCQTDIGLWPCTSCALFFPEVQNATFQNGSGGLVVPRYFCQTDIGLWPCTSCALLLPEVQKATFQNGSGGLVVPRYFVRLTLICGRVPLVHFSFWKCKMPLFRLEACGWWYLRHFVRLFSP